MYMIHYWMPKLIKIGILGYIKDSKRGKSGTITLFIGGAKTFPILQGDENAYA